MKFKFKNSNSTKVHESIISDYLKETSEDLLSKAIRAGLEYITGVEDELEFGDFTVKSVLKQLINIMAGVVEEHQYSDIDAWFQLEGFLSSSNSITFTFSMEGESEGNIILDKRTFTSKAGEDVSILVDELDAFLNLWYNQFRL